ncbi:sensor histidine kinase [Dinghuibacter silviterrae]|uniref:Histidine kinase n=1 Tax=Dinghuibacter silviterrae TaxID=1539049 RepID=A0A4R8DHW3_9BACT|nr:histidine kinase [Dinghuibacter silviterrae]TDW96854.1 histidine kinase [Dinghuibacter silviterrae]
MGGAVGMGGARQAAAAAQRWAAATRRWTAAARRWAAAARRWAAAARRWAAAAASARRWTAAAASARRWTVAAASARRWAAARGWALALAATAARMGAAAQVPTGIEWNNYSTSFAWNGRNTDSPFLETAVPYNGKYFQAIDHTPAVPLEPERDWGYFRELNAYDSSDVFFYAPGVTRENAGRFEYRILRDAKTEVVPWSAFHAFTDAFAPNGDGKPSGLLGGYHTDWDHYLVAELRDKETHRMLATSVVYWEQMRPELFNIYMPDELGSFLEMNDFLQHVTNNYNLNPSAEDTLKWLRKYPRSELDSGSGLPKHLRLHHDENNLIFYLAAHIFDRKALEYQLVRDGQIIVPWKTNDFDLNFIWLRDLSPGTYVLNMRFSGQRHNPNSYGFVIEPAWTQTVWFKVCLLAAAVLCGAVAWWLLWLGRRAQRERLNREKLRIELKSIRSQLNPHFVFNALSSIQALINKGDVEGANRYLSDFGHLLRNSLKASRHDFTPLEAEIQTLDTYLKLEQLRFPFVYTMHKAPDLPVADLEIPSLLLQPLVENAVKHGISALRDEGRIDIGFLWENGNFTCLIRDNGKGFDPSQVNGGYGLTLTRERIGLLNEVLDGSSIRMDLHTTPGMGTTVTLVFQHWIQ